MNSELINRKQCFQGTLGFERQINGLFELRDYLVSQLKQFEDFELVLEEVKLLMHYTTFQPWFLNDEDYNQAVLQPECTNVCFWYVPPSCATLSGNRRFERMGRVSTHSCARWRLCITVYR